eukprot:2274580-Prymnesium_polylepis.1
MPETIAYDEGVFPAPAAASIVSSQVCAVTSCAICTAARARRGVCGQSTRAIFTPAVGAGWGWMEVVGGGRGVNGAQRTIVSSAR